MHNANRHQPWVDLASFDDFFHDLTLQMTSRPRLTSKKAKIKQTSEEHKSGLKLILGTPEIICIGSHARIVAEYKVVDDVIL